MRKIAINVRKFIEEVYEKDVNHNREFEGLDVQFESDSDSRDPMTVYSDNNRRR